MRDLDKIQRSSGKETTTTSFPAPLPRQRPPAEGLCIKVMRAARALSLDHARTVCRPSPKSCPMSLELAVPARVPARVVAVWNGGGGHSCLAFDVAAVTTSGELSEFALTPQIALMEEDPSP